VCGFPIPNSKTHRRLLEPMMTLPMLISSYIGRIHQNLQKQVISQLHKPRPEIVRQKFVFL
jgi:hypothetical protein